jgi:hypothetical protein
MASSSSRGPREEPYEGALSKARPKPPWYEKKAQQKNEGSLLGFSQSQRSSSSEWPKYQWQKWDDAGRESIDIVVDSGASTSMLPESIAKEHPMKPGTPKTYKTASKETVEKLGEKDLVCGFMHGTECRTRWEVGDINRPLSSVCRMVESRNVVWFDSEENGGSGVCNYDAGVTAKIFEKDGICILPAWIRPAEKGGGTPGFTRQVHL